MAIVTIGTAITGTATIAIAIGGTAIIATVVITGTAAIIATTGDAASGDRTWRGVVSRVSAWSAPGEGPMPAACPARG